MSLHPCSVLFSLVLASSLASAAQLPQPGTPASARHPRLLPTEVPEYVLPHPDVARLMSEDDQRGNWPARYGAVIPAGYSSDDAGRWDQLPSGEIVWRMRLRSPGARSLGVLFDRYELPASGKLFLYGQGRDKVLGAFTSATRQPNGMLAVQPLKGDELTIEYVQDGSDPGRPELRLGEVVHDYRGILDMVFDSPVALSSSAGCLVDINCPQGADYQDIKRSVIFVLFSGSYCSAGMLNNTAEDGTPYFLTANHCGNMTNVVAVFGFENAGCGIGPASQANTISGATLLAASVRFDSQLYLLSSTPPQSFAPFYAGWERGKTTTGPGISISHPNGLPKKIARDNQAPSLSGTKWQPIWESGKLEPGSSGSPLFSGAKRVLGPACCVSGFTCNGQWAYYGRLGGFWAEMFLGPWLDPLGTKAQVIDGYDPFRGQAFVYNGGGTNIVKYASTSDPTVGTTWTATVDASFLPFPTKTWVFGYAAPKSNVFVSYGEVLVDTATTRFFNSFANTTNGIATHSNPIPSLPSLIGQRVYTQAVIVGTVPLFLTNGIELRMR